MKLRFYVLTLTAFLLSYQAISQCTSITLTSQAAVDAFPTLGCSQFRDITIHGFDITHLDSLHALTLASKLTIDSTGVTDFHGLEQLGRVNGEMIIRGNTKLRNIDALHNVAMITGVITHQGISIINNPMLQTIRGLSGLRILPAQLYVSGNSSLKNFEGLDSLNLAVGLVISDNDSLENIDGLHGLTRLSVILQITNNPRLQNIDGLISITDLGPDRRHARLLIGNNASLRNVNGLASLNHFSGTFNTFSLSGNPVLTEACAIAQLLRSNLGCNCENNQYIENTIYVDNNGPGVTFDGIVDGCGNERCSGDFTFSLQSEVDAFKEDYGCKIVNGSLHLKGIGIYNVDSLITIEKVKALKIESTSVSNIEGFRSLRSVHGSIQINDNWRLENIDGFFSLTSVRAAGDSSQILITSNADLLNLDGLYGLKTLDGSNRELIITNNQRLANACGVKQLILDSLGCTSCAINIDVSNNAPGVTPEGIIANCQNKCESNVRFVSQAMVDAFPVRGCDIITGDVSISGTDITNLDSLHMLRSIGGNVRIEHTSLINLHGLDQLQNTGGMLWVSQNSELREIDALMQLKEVGMFYLSSESLVIYDNPRLINLLGLSGLRTLPGSLSIAGLPLLKNLDGLDSIQSLRSLNISDNDSLRNINALRNLKNYTGRLTISGNELLDNVDGLSSMTVALNASVLSTMTISDNPSLTNLDGLASLKAFAGGIAYLTITNNPKLTRACAIFELIQDNLGCHYCTAHIIIENNGPGVTREGIVERCGVPQPTNLVFSDLTDTTVTVSFTGAQGADGYIAIMRSFESSFPDDAPIDGREYHVGQVIGYSSIVVSVSSDTILPIVYMTPGIDYWFDIYSYKKDSSYYYVTTTPLEGMIHTLPELWSQPWPNPFVDNVTIQFTTNTNDEVTVVIFDSIGSTVAELTRAASHTGEQHVIWNGKDRTGNDVPHGTYYYQIIKHDGVLRGRLVK